MCRVLPCPALQIRQARKSLAAQRWAAAISKARFIARMRISDRNTEAGMYKLADVMSSKMGAEVGQNPAYSKVRAHFAVQSRLCSNHEGSRCGTRPPTSHVSSTAQANSRTTR